jgi:hypothetical protein
LNGTGEGRRRRFSLLLAPLVLGAIAIPASRSDAAEAAKPTAAQVADGLKTVQHHAEEVVEYAGTDKAKAQKEWDEAHETWEGIEDTIRDNDKDAYVAFEDALEGLSAAAKAGDAKKAAEEAGALAKATTAYLAKYPADAPAAKPAAAAAAAAPAPDPPASAAGRSADAATSAAAPDATLARTGSGTSALTALAGAAFALGGLGVISGARRRRLTPTA